MNEEQFWALYTEQESEPVLDKRGLRQKIEADTEAYLAAGNKIQVIPPGGGSEYHWALDPERLVDEQEAPKVLGAHPMAFNNGRRHGTLWSQPFPAPEVHDGVEYWRVRQLLDLRYNKGGVKENGKWARKSVDSRAV